MYSACDAREKKRVSAVTECRAEALIKYCWAPGEEQKKIQKKNYTRSKVPLPECTTCICDANLCWCCAVAGCWCVNECKEGADKRPVEEFSISVRTCCEIAEWKNTRVKCFDAENAFAFVLGLYVKLAIFFYLEHKCIFLQFKLESNSIFIVQNLPYTW